MTGMLRPFLAKIRARGVVFLFALGFAAVFAGPLRAEAPFTLEVRAEPARPVAGKPVTLVLAVRSRETGRPVTEFELVREELFHLILVRDDLGQLFHEQPEPGPDGSFRISFTFPTGGDWRLFGEFAPKGAGTQIVTTTLAVEGMRGMRAALRPALQPIVRQNDMTLVMQPMNLAAGRDLSMTFALTDRASRPLTDLQPRLGATAHLIFVEQDARTLVHAVPDAAGPRSGRNGNLTFLARFPRAGIYRGWVEFRRGGIVHAIPFAVRVADEK